MDVDPKSSLTLIILLSKVGLAYMRCSQNSKLEISDITSESACCQVWDLKLLLTTNTVVENQPIEAHIPSQVCAHKHVHTHTRTVILKI